MAAIRIKLDNISKVKAFVDIAKHHTEKFELLQGRFLANGKSIMGVFSLDLADELTLEIKPEENLPAILRELNPYMIE